MSINHVKRRYVKLDVAEAEPLWQQQFNAAGERQDNGFGGSGWRVREIVLVGGLVLPIWGMVERALVRQQRPADRRMTVLRLQTTGKACSVALLTAVVCMLQDGSVGC